MDRAMANWGWVWLHMHDYRLIGVLVFGKWVVEVWDAGLQCWISIIGCILQIRMEWLLYPLCKWSVRLKCLVMGSEWWDLWVVGNGNGLSVYVLCIKVGLSIKRPVNMYYTIYRSLCYWVVRILVVLAICINFDCLNWFVGGVWWWGGNAGLVRGALWVLSYAEETVQLNLVN